MAIRNEELFQALAEAAIACAVKAKATAESQTGHPITAETWASAAAQLCYAARGISVPLPARPAP